MLQNVDIIFKISKILLIVLNMILILSCIQYLFVQNLSYFTFKNVEYFYNSSQLLYEMMTNFSEFSEKLVIILFIINQLISMISIIYYGIKKLIFSTFITTLIFAFVISISGLNQNLLIIKFLIIFISIAYIVMIRNDLHRRQPYISMELFNGQL
jgi:hypothetical protein